MKNIVYLLAISLLIGCGSPKDIVVTDELGLVSISVNSSWKVEKSTGQSGLTQLDLFGRKGKDKGMAIMWFSRLLFNNELTYDRDQLLIAMMDESIKQYESDGCIIADKGRTKPLLKQANTVTAVVKCEKQLFTFWTAIEGNRVYNLIIGTNLEEISTPPDLNYYYDKVKHN